MFGKRVKKKIDREFSELFRNLFETPIIANFNRVKRKFSSSREKRNSCHLFWKIERKFTGGKKLVQKYVNIGDFFFF